MDNGSAININDDKISRIEQLQAGAHDCRLCNLSVNRSNVVFGVGNPKSPLMLIGEGPGMNEDATGFPFVGRAGQLLDECLREAGMLRKHVYITNVIKCRAAVIEDGRLQNRTPLPEEVCVCVPAWLEKQIDIIQPLVIVCLGGPSANTIIHKGFRMLQERGRWFESKYTRYAMAALHPAYILRQQGDEFTASRQSLINDLIEAKEKAKAAKIEPKLSLF